MADLHFLCFGAGAIGTYIGGSLVLSGQDVVFIERSDIAVDLREKGMRLKLTDGEHKIAEPRIAPSVEAALDGSRFDIAIFAVKSFDTAPVLESLTPLRDRLPTFLSLQNGVENEQKLASFLGRERVIPATITSAIGRRAAGDIILERLRGMGVASGNPLSEPLIAAFNAAGLQARLFENPVAMKWSKLLTNLIANASSAILDMSPGQIFHDPGLFRLEVKQLRETLRVMAAQNIPVVDLPGTPVRLLAFGLNYLPLPLLQPLLARAAGSGRGGKMPSFHIDLYAGRGRSEVEFLNGAVVRFGERVGIPTPVNRVLTETLLALSEGKIAKEEFAHHPEILLKKVSEQISFR